MAKNESFPLTLSSTQNSEAGTHYARTTTGDQQVPALKNVPLRSPKAEIISKDLVTSGFRYVGPVIVYSFMQAAGMTVDHLLHCYRYGDCVDLAERPWRHF
ncbi:hypothetical protein SASPL_110396 [Salvia splendens]|uniref:DNA-3-methyladenine glycosylase I n=1 Tax=Salvia splendens TaxID=180675 RepID=A0A8X9A2P8_SALSN|nr:hypothetical protein SASPL_110396 [Salvia splendens]